MALPEAEMRDMRIQEPMNEVALEKAEHDHVELKGKVAAEDEMPVSPFRDMPRRQAIRVFWRVCLYSILVAWVAIMDGFLITSRSLSPCAASVKR